MITVSFNEELKEGTKLFERGGGAAVSFNEELKGVRLLSKVVQTV